ncbi:esterase/lipase family protein [Pseudonocardia alni]|uniref:Triacylglycerol esterase/lipase EstA (Alpha/beta hydrolase family) n=1 Tax=Pseudonocardia alni TaxID=33907 RepID=A0AA44UM41_PSEA5|nr:hypothetical protein [Pseudonocardia alni]PKB29666.1 triacylglycerol esterase/lipase EstA (alpha/beta hydrolase family) [Pseudonocardia alni]
MLTALVAAGLEKAGELTMPAAEPAAWPDLHVHRDPVLLLGGLGTTAPFLRPLAGWLRARGHPVVAAAVGAGLGCGRATTDQLELQLAELADATGRPVRLVGHSRGGQFARALAHRRPELVSGLITVGTPFRLVGLRAPMLVTVAALTGVGTAGLTGVARTACLVGRCCRGFRDAQRAPVPATVPFTCIYSRGDRVAPPRVCTDPQAVNMEVPGGHTGLLIGAHAREAIAEALDRDTAHDDSGTTRHTERCPL